MIMIVALVRSGPPEPAAMEPRPLLPIRFSLPADVPVVLGDGDGAGRVGSPLIEVPATAPERPPDRPAVSSIPPYTLPGRWIDEPLPPGVIARSRGVIRAGDRRYSFTFLHRPWTGPAWPAPQPPPRPPAP